MINLNLYCIGQCNKLTVTRQTIPQDQFGIPTPTGCNLTVTPGFVVVFSAGSYLPNCLNRKMYNVLAH